MQLVEGKYCIRGKDISNMSKEWVKKSKNRISKLLKKTMIVLGILFGIGILCVIGMNSHLVLSVSERILTETQAANLMDVDCILVLGAGVRPDGSPSHMLQDRILEGVNLYELQVSDKLIMSGDHGTMYYDEVNCMKGVAMDEGVPSSAVFMDHAGFSTYDSMYRASHIFGAKKIVIVTQDYHMYRALYDAKSLGMDAYGVISNPRSYSGQKYREVREILARCKDVLKCIQKPEAKIMGDPISLQQDGDITNDQ